MPRLAFSEEVFIIELMATITIPKNQYEILEKKAKLYNILMQDIEEFFPVELYTPSRLRDFLRLDKISTRAQRKAEKFLKKR